MTDIVERLRVSLERRVPNAEHICGVLPEELKEAIDEIEFLRKHAGAITRGPSFLDIAKDTPKRMSVEGGS